MSDKTLEWDSLVCESGGEFLQGFWWGEFERSLGKRVERIKKENFQAQIIFNPLFFGLDRGYIPRGPVFFGESMNEQSFWNEFNKTKKKRTIFFEFDLPRGKSFIKSSNLDTRQPAKTVIVENLKNKNDIFNGFHPMLVRNIKRAEREGVKIKKEDGWNNFFKLLTKTTRRQNFRAWPASYFSAMWNVLSPVGEMEIWSAYKDSQLLATNLYILFCGRATYLFGASDYKKRNLMAPHLLHWEMIKNFGERGFSEYDLWGIDEKKWPGITEFKLRFGGRIKDYPGHAVKVERHFWYKIYNILKKWR